jgi:hypothetical protein
MFEGGGSRFPGWRRHPDPIEKAVPDLPTNAFFAYGHYEDPRVLDLMDKHEIKLSSFMTRRSNLARSRSVIVRRGHEAAKLCWRPLLRTAQ